MTSPDPHDAMLEQLASLSPDPDRAERVRLRCGAQLERRRRRTARATVISEFAWHVLGPAVVGGFCVLYIAALVVTTLRLKEVFQ